jgi:hypothetical protein
MTERTFKLVSNKERSTQKLKAIAEVVETQKKNQEAYLTEQAARAAVGKGAYMNTVNTPKLRRFAKQKEIKDRRMAFLKEFVGDVVVQALSIDQKVKESYKTQIIGEVYDYFDSNASTTMASSLAALTNPTTNFAMLQQGGRVDGSIMAFCDKIAGTKVLANSQTENSGDVAGRVSALDFVNMALANTEADLQLGQMNEALEVLKTKTADAIKDKVLTIMKEEAEITEKANFINEQVKNDPMFLLKNKNMKRLAEKNTIFREIYRTHKVLNEGKQATDDEFFAESLLTLTIMETCNSLYLENETVKSRMAHENNKRLAHYRAQRVAK